MNQENSKRLFEEFPELFRKELLLNGFECQDGWFFLLHDLAMRIDNHLRYDFLKNYVEITAIRQVMGRLKFTTCTCDGSVLGMLDKAEAQSTTLCELDGNPANGLYVCPPYWQRYLCKRCADLHDCMRGEDAYLQETLAVSLHELKNLSNGSVFV